MGARAAPRRAAVSRPLALALLLLQLALALGPAAAQSEYLMLK